MRSRRSGATLLELLVVISIIGLLLALIIPAVQQARESSRRLQCRSHLRQIGIAVHNYESVHGMFPPGSSRAFSLHVFLLPYVDQNALYQHADFEVGGVKGSGILAASAVSIFPVPAIRWPARAPTGAPMSQTMRATSATESSVSGTTACSETCRLC